MAYYDRYRGSRRRRRNRIKIILLILLLLVVIGLAALFLLQDAVIFTSDGFRFAFSSQEEPEQTESGDQPGDIQLEIEDPQPGSDQLMPPNTSAQPQQPSQPVEQPLPEPVELPQTAALLLDGTALLTDSAGVLRQISQGSFVQMALQVKTPDGLALLDDGDVKDGVREEAESFLHALDHVDVPKIAVISALRDNVRPRTGHRASALHTASGATWLDREYISWFDPAGADTLECLLAMIRACEAAGFEQVVLQNFHYPTAGKLELIDYGDDQSRRTALSELARQLRDATDMPLGLVLTETAASDLLDGTSGQDVAELAQYFDLFYVPASGFDADVSAVEHAAEGTQCRVGLLLDQAAVPPVGFDRDYIAAEK